MILQKATGCIKKNKTLLFSPNFQPKSLGNGWSDLLKNHCAKSPHGGLFVQEISSDSDKWFPSYCGWKLGEKKSVLFFLRHPVVCILYRAKVQHYCKYAPVIQCSTAT